jgi:hypothetical protein
VVECLLSIPDALSSNSGTTKKKKKKFQVQSENFYRGICMENYP